MSAAQIKKLNHIFGAFRGVIFSHKTRLFREAVPAAPNNTIAQHTHPPPFFFLKRVVEVLGRG